MLDKNGEPVAGLTADDFTLMIDGAPRRVLSAEFISQIHWRGCGETYAGKRQHYSSNESAVGGRLVLLAFDLEGIAAGGGRDAAKAATSSLNGLRPGDQVGVISFPYGLVWSSRAIDARCRGPRESRRPWTTTADDIYTVGVQEAFDIEAGNDFALTVR